MIATERPAMRPIFTSLLALALSLASLTSAFAADTVNPGPNFERVTLDPIRHQTASLTLTAPDGHVVAFTPAELEALGSWRLTTKTPWRDMPATFEGPLLGTVLAAAGMSDVARISVLAENDYAVSIDRAVWDAVPILVATRVNGAAHNRRDRGPIQFVMDMDTYKSSPIAAERHWVWMAAKITPAP